MARPTDWTPLGIGIDPLPGDPGAIETAGQDYKDVASAISRASTNLEALTQDDTTVSEAVDAFRSIAVEVAERIVKAQERYQGVGEAVLGYAPTLRTAQGIADDALAAAILARENLESAGDSAVQWADRLRDPDLSPEDVTKFEGLLDTANSDNGDAQAAIAAAVEELQRAITMRNTAADAAAALIEDVENSGDLNDGFWQNVDQFFKENPWVDKFFEYAGYAALALTIIAMFVPGLNVLVMVVAVALAALTVLNAAAQVATGNKSLVEGIIEVAFALVPLGVGAVVGRAISRTASNTAATATTAVMRSAAGRGVSGVTRSVATEVTSRITSIAAGPLRTGTMARELADIAALTSLRFANGAPAPSILGAADNYILLAGGWAVNEGAGTFGADLINGMLPQGVKNETTASPQRTAQNEDW